MGAGAEATGAGAARPAGYVALRMGIRHRAAGVEADQAAEYLSRLIEQGFGHYNLTLGTCAALNLLPSLNSIRNPNELH